MVIFESMGENDFRSVYKSVDEEMKEAEERTQTEMMLRVLDDLDARITTKDKPRKKKKRPRRRHRRRDDYSDSESESESESESDYEHVSHQRRTIGRPYRPTKELMRVSIVDDEKARRDHAREESRRESLHGKVHTLDDLPRDEMDFGSFFSSPATPEPDITIQAGRRLMDGKVLYSASFPGFMDGFELDNIDFQIELAIIFVLVVFLVGIFIGKKANNRRNARAITQLKQKHTGQLQAMQRNFQVMSGYGMMRQNPNPVYIPVPMQKPLPQKETPPRCQKAV